MLWTPAAGLGERRSHGRRNLHPRTDPEYRPDRRRHGADRTGGVGPAHARGRWADTPGESRRGFGAPARMNPFRSSPKAKERAMALEQRSNRLPERRAMAVAIVSSIFVIVAILYSFS